MCLHGPAQLGVYDAERTDQAGRIKVTQYRECRRRAKRTTSTRSEKLKAARTGDPQMTGDIHTQRNSADELLASHLYTRINVLAIDLGQSYRQGARHGMHYCTFVHAVEFGVVHLVGITQRSRRSAERH